MSNSFNISDKPEIAANLVQILSNASALATIQITTLPDISTQNTDIKSVVDAIADPQLPDILTAVGANETKIDENKAVIDAILEDTAALPQNVRGKWYTSSYIGADSDFQTVINITGQGKLLTLAIIVLIDSDTVEVRLTVNGDVWNVVSHTGDTIWQSVYIISTTNPEMMYKQATVVPLTEMRLFGLEFSDSLLIEARRSAGVSSNVKCKVQYLLDDF